MPLKLYRRHRKECEASFPEGAFSGEYEEGRRGAKRCACIIHVSGTLAGRFNRKQTGSHKWEEARAIARTWEAAGSWHGSKQPFEAPAAVESAHSAKISITDATDAYLARCANRGIRQSTLSKYQTFVKQLRGYADLRGYFVVQQLTVADMDRFYASWKDGKRARAKKLERLKSFVRFCLKRKWLSEDITEDLQVPEGSSIPANKDPFTDAELERIYKACDAVGGPTSPGPGYRSWTGEDVKDFIMLSVYTGLRISDVATFDISERLKGNDVFLRMHKTGKELYTWIPDWLVARLRAREQRQGSMIFKTGESYVMRTMAELWRVKIARVFSLSGPWRSTATPHRFRHTFVRILLEKGVPIADVAELIGDREEVVRRHYAKWVPERQDRLRSILQQAFEERVTPKVVSIR